jgi:enoyl-CoA hydratase
MTEGDSEVLVQRDGRVLVITINRPDRRNAMTLAASHLIATALTELDANADLTVGILTGNGGNFCAGMDLKRFLLGERPFVPGHGFGGLTEAPPAKPLIAAVEGYALAGGFELVLACDMVVAGESARFGLPEVTRGLIARAGGLLRLPQRVPRSIALELILTGDMLSASQAATFGLVNRLVADGRALEEAKKLAASIAKNAPMAVVVSKQVVVESPEWPVGEMFSRQFVASEPVFNSEDATEGATAFAEKRQPIWRGR